MVDSDVFQKFVEYPPENGTITKILYEYDMAAPINEHPDCSEQCLRDVEDLVKEPEDDVVDIKLCGTKIIKVEPDRYRAIREKTNYEDVPTHPNILKISHFTYHERTDCYVFVYDVGCEVTKLSEFVKTATLEDRKCLVEQVIKLVQHFHTHHILYGHLQPDLMYVVLSEKNRKPQLKVGSFLKTAFCDTRTEIPDFSGSCKEESTMLEDLKDAAHVIAFIYNQGDTARTTDIANNVMEELQSMSLDIEKRTIESVMLQIWSDVDSSPNENQSLVLYNFTDRIDQSVENVKIMSMLPEIWSYWITELHHENRLFDFLEGMIAHKQWDEFRGCMEYNKDCKFSRFEITEFVKSNSTLLHPGIEVKRCNGCASSSTNCFAADEKFSEQTEEKRFKSFPSDFDDMHPILLASPFLAKHGFRYLSDRHVIQLLMPCSVLEEQFQPNMVKKVKSCGKRSFDPGQTKRRLAIKDKA